MFSVIRIKAGSIHTGGSRFNNRVGFFVADAGTMLTISRSDAADILKKARKHAVEYPSTCEKPTRTVYAY
jgi:hypothetical protein